MKALWFITNLNYKQNDPYVGCGWISSLLDKIILQENVEVALAFFSENVKTLTVHNEGRYSQFVIPSYTNRMDKIVRNLTFTDYLFNKREEILLSVIKQFNPDIIHVFGTECPFGLLAAKTQIPVVVHIQGILNPYVKKWFPVGYNNFQMFWNTSFFKAIKLSGYWADFIRQKKLARREVEIFNVTRYFSGRTDWDRRLVGLMSQESKYYHCEEMLRPTFYNHQWRIHENSDKIQLISIINPNMYKGIETILETAKHLKTFSKYQIAWTIAGVSHDSPLVKIFTKKTKISPKDVGVEFIGPTQETLLVNKMLDADLFIHPSHIDNSPNSLCEAMVLGMPIISSNVGGIQSLLSDKVEGLLVQDGETFGLAGAILELINNPSRSVSYGQAARQRAVERHNPNEIVNKQLFIYQDILKIYDTKNSNTTYLSQQEG
jgi:glycosyltransferase involved in cell wall biosynthesis